MTDKRKFEIAMGVVRYMLRKQGVTLKPEGKRELGNAAKAIGVPVEELKDFMYFKIIRYTIFLNKNLL